MKGYFVTGTDTGVGKTHVTAQLAQLARATGKRVFAFKPIETGAVLVDGRRVGADQEAISSAWQVGPQRSVYLFEQPRGPRVAAEAEGVTIDLDRIIEAFQTGAAGADLVLVEGAGGWRVPITRTEDMASLARRLALPVVIVARAGLGTINHTLLTVEAVRRDRCAVAPVVLSVLPGEDLSFATQNASEIEDRAGLRVVILGTDSAVLDSLLLSG